MTIQAVAGQQTVEGIVDGLTALKAALLTGAKAHLYKSSLAPTANTTEADFEAAECDFVGYASVALTWSAIGIDSVGNPVAISTRSVFQATDATVPNTAGGLWVTHEVTGPPATHTPVEYYPFTTPVPFTRALALMGAVVGYSRPGQPGVCVVDY